MIKFGNPFIRFFLLPTLSSVILSIILLPTSAIATPLGFTPPTQITVKMYELNGNGVIVQPDIPCQTNDIRYGCTYFDGGTHGLSPTKPYPFPSDTMPVDIEGYMFNNIQQGYLHNVISQEMAEGSPVASYTAQAIAART